MYLSIMMVKACLIKKLVYKNTFEYIWNVAVSKKPCDSFSKTDATTHSAKYARIWVLFDPSRCTKDEVFHYGFLQ